MKVLQKKNINEIIDSNDNLIGHDEEPENGNDLETRANRTTDFNARAHAQNFKNDFLGRFGFYFYESEDKGDNIPPIVMDLAKLMYDKYIETLEHYAQNPEKLHKDMELHSEVDFTTQPEDSREHDFEWAWDILDVVNKHYEGEAEGDTDAVNEEKVLEDTLQDKKDNKELKDKKEDNALKSKKIEDVADLLNKLPKNEKDKLIKLLEA